MKFLLVLLLSVPALSRADTSCEESRYSLKCVCENDTNYHYNSIGVYRLDRKSGMVTWARTIILSGSYNTLEDCRARMAIEPECLF